MRYCLEAYGQRFYGSTKFAVVAALEAYEREQIAKDPQFRFQSLLDIKENDEPIN